jgi:hypothetical protein
MTTVIWVASMLSGCIPVTRFSYVHHVKVEIALHPNTYEITKFIKGQHSVLNILFY